MKQLTVLTYTAILLYVVACTNTTKNAATDAIADAVYFNGDIITMEGDSANYVEAVAIKNDKIIFTGSKADAEKLRGDSTVMNDLKGKTMLPGFIDPHIHPSIAASILPMEIVSAMEWNTPNGKSVVVKDHNAFINRLKALDKSYTDPNKVLITWGYFKPYHGSI
ncbi:MAG: hypothetical protein RLZZ316_902, partial [Bacteroidota bacterium]